MKLKKIASLALAGILAVSMLAGCGNNGDSNSTVNPPVEETPVGYTATIYNQLNSSAQSVLDAGNGNVLKAAVESSASALDNTAFVTAPFVTGLADVTVLTNANTANVQAFTAVQNMSRYLTAHGQWDVYGDNAAEGAVIALPIFGNTTADNGTKVYVLLAPSSLTDTVINNGVTEFVEDLTQALPAESATHTFSYELGVERSLIGSTNEGVYLIGVQITKTSDAK